MMQKIIDFLKIYAIIISNVNNNSILLYDSTKINIEGVENLIHGQIYYK